MGRSRRADCGRPRSFRRALRAMLAIVAVALSLSACGRVPAVSISPSGSPSADSTPSTPPSPSPSRTAEWQTYTDPTYGFSLSYPPTFVLDNPTTGPLTPGWLLERRIVDAQFVSGYPPGDIDFGVYAFDSTTLDGWVRQHTGPCGSPNSKEFYWDNVVNLSPVTVASRAGQAFDWDQRSCGPNLVLHETVFLFSNDTYVFRLDWLASSADYSGTIQTTGQQVIQTFVG